MHPALNPYTRALLLGSLLVGTVTAQAQRRWYRPEGGDVAVVGNLEQSRLAANGAPNFWIKGMGVDGSLNLYRGVGLAANLTVGYIDNIGTGYPLGKAAAMVGPRYTFDTTRHMPARLQKYPTRVFGEALFGQVFAFNSSFPNAAGGIDDNAQALSMQFGGGIDVTVHHHLGVRLLEMDLVRTKLPNNVGNTQDDLRVAVGLSYHR